MGRAASIAQSDKHRATLSANFRGTSRVWSKVVGKASLQAIAFKLSRIGLI